MIAEVLCINKVRGKYEVTGTRLYGRYVSIPMAEYRVWQIRNSRKPPKNKG